MATDKLKVGRKVAITKRPTNHTAGRINGIRETGRGTWYDVNVADKRNPFIASYRAGDLQPA